MVSTDDFASPRLDAILVNDQPPGRCAIRFKMATARDTAAALKSRREERDAWRGAVQDLRKELATSAEENARRLDALERQFSEERTAWRSETRKAKGTALLWALLAGGIGFAVGRR